MCVRVNEDAMMFWQETDVMKERRKMWWSSERKKR